MELQRAELTVIDNSDDFYATLIHRIAEQGDDTIDTDRTSRCPIKDFYIDRVRFSVDAKDWSVLSCPSLLSIQGIYLVVADFRTAESCAFAQSLLSLILTLSSRSPPEMKKQVRVLLAITGVEDDGDLEKQILNNFVHLGNSSVRSNLTVVNASSNRGISELRKLLLLGAQNNPTKQVVPSATLPIVDALERSLLTDNSSKVESKGARLDVHEFKRSLCGRWSDLQVDDAIELMMQWRLVSVLSNKKAILHRQDIFSVLKRIAFKQNRTCGEAGNGILAHSDEALRALWGEYDESLWRCDGGNASSISPFLQVLYDADLAYQMKDSFGGPVQQSVVPAMFREEPEYFNGKSDVQLLQHCYLKLTSKEIISEQGVETVEIQFQFLPTSLFSSLLCRLRGMVAVQSAWKSGALIVKGASFALLVTRDRSLTVSCVGDDRCVRSVVLFALMRLKDDVFPSILVSDVILSVDGRKWHADEINEALHFLNGDLFSRSKGRSISVVSLSMLFPLRSVLKTDDESRLRIFLNQLDQNREKFVSNREIIVLISEYLKSYLPIYLEQIGFKPVAGSQCVLWVALQRHVDEHVEYATVPLSPQLLPDEPWVAVDAAKILFTPSQSLVDAFSGTEKERALKYINAEAAGNLIKKALSFMRGSLHELLPKGWSLAQFQWQGEVGNEQIRNMEDKFFFNDGSHMLWKKVGSKTQTIKLKNVRINMGINIHFFI